MKILVIFAVLVVASGVPVQRTKRSYNHYPSHVVYSGNQPIYSSQAVSSPLYSAASSAEYDTQPLPYDASPSLHNLPLSQTTTYGTPLTYASASTYNAPISEQQSVSLYNTPAQVSTPTLYNAEHYSHASASSYYRVQAPATLTYDVQVPRAQYISPQHQYIAPRHQYVAASSNWQNNASWGARANVDNVNNPWC